MFSGNFSLFRSILFILIFSTTVNAQKIYWTDFGSIQRSNLDGSNFERLFQTSFPLGMFLDRASQKIYWINGARINRINLDGSDNETLISSGITGLRQITLDTRARKMYWGDTVNHKIQRANLDGSDIEDVITDVDNPRGIAVDSVAKKLYWTSWVCPLSNCHGKIQRADLDGSNIEDIVTEYNSGLDITGC